MNSALRVACQTSQYLVFSFPFVFYVLCKLLSNLIDALKFDLFVHKQFSILLITVPIFWFAVHLFHYLHVYFLIILSNFPPCFVLSFC